MMKNTIIVMTEEYSVPTKVNTIKEALALDYIAWRDHKKTLIFFYRSIELKRKRGEYVSFLTEIEYLETQISKIDKEV